jgi:hypothetical protein
MWEARKRKSGKLDLQGCGVCGFLDFKRHCCQILRNIRLILPDPTMRYAISKNVKRLIF